MRLPGDALLGREGEGWAQVTGELAYERSGPERFLSSFRLLVELVRALQPAADARAEIALGRLGAQLVTLRRMSRSVAGLLQAGADPALEAAMVKDLGALVEQEIPRSPAILMADGRSPRRPHRSRAFAQVLAYTRCTRRLLAARRHPRDPARHHRPRPRAQVNGDPS